MTADQQPTAFTLGLFDGAREAGLADVDLGPGAALLRGHALHAGEALLDDLRRVVEAAPMRHLVTPGGRVMSVSMTNCGEVGWVSDPDGYRYDPLDPATGRPWPAMPDSFREVAAGAAARAGFEAYAPDVCLINGYQPGARLSLHQDRDERRLGAPIVTVSLGLPATFLFGGPRRSDRARRFTVHHGDVAVWGGASRMAFHGIEPLKDGIHPLLGHRRVSLAFRRAR